MASKIQNLEHKEESPELKARVAQVEKALKERNIEEALVVLEPWVQEFGHDENLKKAIAQLREDYKEALAQWQADKNPEADSILNNLTHSTYKALDIMHAFARIDEEVVSPNVSPNHRDMLAMYAYFEQMPLPQEKELEWFHKKARDPKAVIMDMIVHTLEKSLSECFWEPSLMAIIEEIDSPVRRVARSCATAAISLLITYNDRLPVYPELREAFEKAVEKHGDEMWDAFTTSCFNTHQIYFGIDMPDMKDMSLVPKALMKILQRIGLDIEKGLKEHARDDEGYREMHRLLDHIHGTWVLNTILPQPENWDETQDDGTPLPADSREGKLCYTFIEIGRVEFLLDEPEKAERWLTHRIEEEHTPNPLDYLHFGHVMIIKGEREKGMDYYRKALEMSGDKEFFFERLQYEKRFMKEYHVADEAQYNEIEDQLRRLIN